MDNKIELEDKLKIVKPIIFWEGFPVCGLLLKKVADSLKEDLIIVATHPLVEFRELEVLLNHKIIWFDNPDDIWLRKQEFNDRNLIIHTGWNHKGWLKYDLYMKKNNEAKTVVVVDNRFRGDLRQFLGAILFRLSLRKYFDSVFVPGKSARKLMTFLGMPNEKIYEGNYGAFEGLFFEKTLIHQRKKEFLFVGQLTKRKGVDILIKAFNLYKLCGGTWDLRIIGNGELHDIVNDTKGIEIESFLQPIEIVERMNSSQVFVLPSRDDNWGTVICEAAACGMMIITTKKTGASEDIIQNNINGIIIPEINFESLCHAFFMIEKMSQDEIINGSKLSKDIASNYNSNGYYKAFLKIVNGLF